jgi:hypothetical protein
MYLKIENNENGSPVIKVVLNLVDVDNAKEIEFTPEEVIELSAGYVAGPGDPFNILTDETKSRSVAALLVGKLTTKWRISLIKDIDTALVEAVRRYMVDAASRGRED